MANVNLALLLHFYQPMPWQSREVLTRIVDRCYRPLLHLIDSRDGFAFSANVNGSLLRLLERDGHRDIIDLIARVVADGKLELFGTVAYHPIVPLCTPEEIRSQIAEDAAIKERFGLPAHTCGGFYLPEYAFSEEGAGVLLEAGFTFTLTDDALFAWRHGHVPTDYLPTVKGMPVFLRSRHWGNEIDKGGCDFDRLRDRFPHDVGREEMRDQPGYKVIAMDAEAFGEHHEHHVDWLLKPMIEAWSQDGSPVDIVPFRTVLQRFGHNRREMFVPAGTWSTRVDDALKGIPFPLWDDTRNVNHRLLWRLVNVARRFDGDPRVAETAMLMLTSCGWWWVSRDTPQFSPNFMKHNADLAMTVIETAGDAAAVREAKHIYDELLRPHGLLR